MSWTDAEDAGWLEAMKPEEQEEVLDVIDAIERGFDDIEHRISNLDKEHSSTSAQPLRE